MWILEVQITYEVTLFKISTWFVPLPKRGDVRAGGGEVPGQMFLLEECQNQPIKPDRHNV